MSLWKFVAGLLTNGPFYVRIRRHLLSVRDSSTATQWQDEPVVCITTDERGAKSVAAVGAAAKDVPGVHVNPFDHPRLLVHDFVVAEKLMRHAFRQLSKHKYFRPVPVVVAHVMEHLEGGLTEIERRVLRETMEGAGAKTVYIWESHELSDRELQQGVYRGPAL